jgi:hypothetical protein
VAAALLLPAPHAAALHYQRQDAQASRLCLRSTSQQLCGGITQQGAWCAASQLISCLCFALRPFCFYFVSLLLPCSLPALLYAVHRRRLWLRRTLWRLAVNAE